MWLLLLARHGTVVASSLASAVGTHVCGTCVCGCVCTDLAVGTCSRHCRCRPIRNPGDAAQGGTVLPADRHRGAGAGLWLPCCPRDPLLPIPTLLGLRVCAVFGDAPVGVRGLPGMWLSRSQKGWRQRCHAQPAHPPGLCSAGGAGGGAWHRRGPGHVRPMGQPPQHGRGAGAGLANLLSGSGGQAGAGPRNATAAPVGAAEPARAQAPIGASR